MTRICLFLGLLAGLGFSPSAVRLTTAQESVRLEKQTLLSAAELKKAWANFGADKGWQTLLADMQKRGLKRIDHEKAAYGFRGVVVENGKERDALFCVFDFYNPAAKGGQGASVLWRKLGAETYKAYIIFPEGQRDPETALEKGEEWFAEGATLKKAQSWTRCFNRCIKTKATVSFGSNRFSTNCSQGCLDGVKACGGAAVVFSVITGGTGIPFALGAFQFCAGLACGPCLGLCALYCL